MSYRILLTDAQVSSLLAGSLSYNELSLKQKIALSASAGNGVTPVSDLVPAEELTLEKWKCLSQKSRESYPPEVQDHWDMKEFLGE